MTKTARAPKPNPVAPEPIPPPADPVETPAPVEPPHEQFEPYRLDGVAWAIWLGGFLALALWHFRDLVKALFR